MRGIISSGWFVFLLIASLVAWSLVNRQGYWAGFFVGLGVVLAIAELVAVRRTRLTLSEQFGEFYADHPARGRWLLALLLAAAAGIAAHLWV